MKRNTRLSTAKKALIFDLSALLALLAVYVGLLLSFFVFGFFLAFLGVVWLIGSPVVGIVLGIIALTEKNRTRSDTASAIVAIVLPVVVVITVILLFSTGVFVIRFM